MATSGYFDGAKSSYGWYARLEYSYTQTTTTNITLTLKVYNGTKPAYNNNTNSAYYVIAGDKFYKTYDWTAIGWNTIGSKTVSVDAGATSYNASAQWVSNVSSTYTPSSLSVSGTITFPAISTATLSTSSIQSLWTGYPNDSISLTTTPSGGTSYSYSWKLVSANGTTTVLGTSKTLSKSAIKDYDGGKIYCVVTSGSNTVETNKCELRVGLSMAQTALDGKDIQAVEIRGASSWGSNYFPFIYNGTQWLIYNWDILSENLSNTAVANEAIAGVAIVE